MTPDSSSDVTADVGRVLDSLHDAASKAAGERYFALFADDGVFIGTDATERWTLEQFRAFAEPLFARGKGWTYTVLERHVTVGPERSVAWFDERLDNAAYGETRGSGVLRRIGGDWRIAQYVLSFAVPNDAAKDVVERIRAEGGGAER